VKLVVTERGSDAARTVWGDSARVASSLLLYPEARAALARAARERRTGATRRATTSLELLWEQVVALEIDEPLVRSAADLAERCRLRAYDAVHLASALSVADDEVVLVSADQALLEAARGMGLTTSAV
jgi:uncharacterized protein